MSTIYNLEPPTNGKVVLKTTAGDIDIELWPKEAPKAVRNFVQLCLEGFYDGCIFHRVLKDFLVQTGDPTGTGTQSETVYDAPFKDEFHSRLRFSHRGIVACANEGREHSNGSQFFITLGPTESLQKKHTIFGRVGGDTIYNVMEMNNLEVDANDRPEDPPYIKEVEVLGNPFDDIEPRTTRAERQAAAERAKAEAAAKAKPKVKKNVALLSFEDDEDGGDGDGEGAAAAAARIRSAHEAIDDERLVKVNTEEEKRLAAQEAVEAAARKAAVQARLAKLSKQAAAADGLAGGAAAGSGGAETEEEGDDTEAGFERRMRAQALAKRQALGGNAAAAMPASRDGKGGAAPKDSDEDSDEDSGSDGGARQKDSERRRSAALAGGSKAAIIRPSRQANIEDADLLKPWELKRRQYKQRARLTGRREADTLAKMREFAAALARGGSMGTEGGGQAAREGSAGAGPSRAAEEEAYAGKVRKDIDHEALKPAAWRIDALQDEDDDDFKGGLDALRQHVLQFPKEAKLGAMDRDMNDDNLMVIDPLLEKGKEQWNRQQAKRQKREMEWSGGSGRGGGGGGTGGRTGGGDRSGRGDRGGRGSDQQRGDERQRW